MDNNQSANSNNNIFQTIWSNGNRGWEIWFEARFIDNYYFDKAFNLQGWKWFDPLTSIWSSSFNPIIVVVVNYIKLGFSRTVSVIHRMESSHHLQILHKLSLGNLYRSECFFKIYFMMLLLHSCHKKIRGFFNSVSGDCTIQSIAAFSCLWLFFPKQSRKLKVHLLTRIMITISFIDYWTKEIFLKNHRTLIIRKCSAFQKENDIHMLMILIRSPILSTNKTNFVEFFVLDFASRNILHNQDFSWETVGICMIVSILHSYALCLSSKLT